MRTIAAFIDDALRGGNEGSTDKRALNLRLDLEAYYMLLIITRKLGGTKTGVAQDLLTAAIHQAWSELEDRDVIGVAETEGLREYLDGGED